MYKNRQLIVFFSTCLLLSLLLSRLFYIQIIKYDMFHDMALKQHNRIFKVEPRRGAIYDRYLEPLAISLDAYSVFADPRAVESKEKAASLLSGVLGIDKKTIAESLAKDKSFVWIKRKVTDEEKKAVDNLNIDGVYFIAESKRKYTNDTMASHVIGFAGLDNSGLEGVELLYDDKLKGEHGYRHFMRDARLRAVMDNTEDSIPARNGYNVVLTIDSVIQYITEKELKSLAEKFHTKSVTCVVMEPDTGKILAMANYPAYNPNNFLEAGEERIKNQAISSVYEPGSVFKIVTASAALNENLFALSDEFYCENGNYNVAGRVLHDYHPYGKLDFKRVFSRSSNIGTVKIAEKLGDKKLHEYVRKFGFGENTGIDLPGEIGGIVRPPSIWSKSDITTIPIGQGIAVTPIQLVTAISVVANGGNLVKPYVVDSVTDEGGRVLYSASPKIKRNILTEDTVLKMKEILRDAVLAGTGRNANSKKYSLCGKTGTAQMVNPRGGYYTDKYFATFIAFAPMENAQISIVITADDPHPGHFGGTVAAPYAKNIAEKALDYIYKNKDEKDI